MKIRGVNLGNWLVLEKWMKPSLFEGTQAADEDALCRELTDRELEERLNRHRETFIGAEDFDYLKEHGINTLRIPVPHFIFGDDVDFCSPYVPCAQYLDRAFEWAEERDMQILIDLHTAPESQNGFDNGGICGVCRWAQSPERVNRLLRVLEQLGNRYGHRKGLWGIELLNEPVSEAVWYRSSRVYLPADSERAKGSSFVPLEVLTEFYRRGYCLLRGILGEDKKIVFHDGFRFPYWRTFFEEEGWKNVVLDVHWYLNYAEAAECHTIQDYVGYILKVYREQITWMKEAVPVIVGEWCLSHRGGVKGENGAWGSELMFRMLAEAQLLAWEEADGYFFWSYRLENGPEGWDFRDCMERGWLPQRLG